MRTGLLIMLLGLAAAPAGAATRLAATPSCAATSQSPLRVAFHPGQTPLRCARFLPTTSLHRHASPTRT